MSVVESIRMLDCEILKTDYGVSYGSVTLKSLQNDNVPELDLLVREAIQNSSDDSLQEEGNSYAVNFVSGTFVPAEFNLFMTDVKDKLNGMFPEAQGTFLEIRDKKTSGLTGNMRKAEIKKDDHGNFFKLIYDTGKRQTISTAGGNWGFGKSVYYRVGIGIVIFYSRIKNAGGYENRLIITLVEDEGKTDASGNDATVLNSVEPLSAGKAWWGIRNGEDLLPLTEDDEIQPVLDVFGIKPFKENETGTSIIIPYINTAELLDGIIPEEAEIESGVRQHFTEVWASSIPDYLRLSIQKWYAPKIHNRELPKFCNNKWLLVSVDNKPIRKQDMLPFFDLTQELYTSALAKTYSYAYKSTDYPQIEVLPVKMQSYFDKRMIVGYVSIARISQSELNGTQNLLSPYDYIGKFEADGGLNEPIMMYARDPGMVIDYAITGPWVKKLTPPESPEDFIFAFFVPITDKTIKLNCSVQEYAGMKLGVYLRECEASDHMGWNDPAKMQIVQRIQKNTINSINRHIKESTEVNIDATSSKLSNRLGKNLLPKIGYGKKTGGNGGQGGGGGSPKITNVSFDFSSQTIKGNEVTLDFVLKLSHNKKVSSLSMMIASEAGWIDAETWATDIGTEFPVQFVECQITSMKTVSPDKQYTINQTCSDKNNQIMTDELIVRVENEKDSSAASQLHFKTFVQSPEISGKIRLRTYDKKYQFSFRVE